MYKSASHGGHFVVMPTVRTLKLPTGSRRYIAHCSGSILLLDADGSLVDPHLEEGN